MQRSLLKVVVLAAMPLIAACAGGNQQASAPAATQAAPADSENVQKEITALEQQWVAAIVAKDAAAVDRLLVDDFIGTTSDAQYGKPQAIDDVKTGTHEMLELSNIVVRVYGDAAVATMDQTEKSHHGTEDFSGKYLFTDVWVKQGGQWRAVSSHGSRIR